MEHERQRIWCHTCKQVFGAVVNDSFEYKCPCGSEFIEEVTDDNDPRLFAPRGLPVIISHSITRSNFPIASLVEFEILADSAREPTVICYRRTARAEEGPAGHPKPPRHHRVPELLSEHRQPLQRRGPAAAGHPRVRAAHQDSG